jgi:hypothetical protein
MYKLEVSAKEKPVSNVDDLLLALTHHWTWDTSKFRTGQQQLDLALIILFAAYTGARPGELVDGRKRRKDKGSPRVDLPASWDDLNHLHYDNDDEDDEGSNDGRRTKALCYEDISMILLRNPRNLRQNVLAMEVRLANHKGCDNKPKPYVTFPLWKRCLKLELTGLIHL